MNGEELQTSGLDLALLLVAGLVLFVALQGARYLLDLVPMSRARRETLARASPAAGAFVGLFYLLFAARTVFKQYPDFVPLVLTLIVVGFIVVAWFAFRDFVAGVVIKAGRVCTVGDFVHVNDVKGRIAQMGLRVLTLETSDGDEAIIPYSSIARESLLRTPVLDSVSLHAFHVKVPDKLETIDAQEVIREAALRSHWSSLVREPKVVSVGDRAFEVTVFALDPGHGPHIERAVRAALDGPPRITPKLPEFRLPGT